MKKKCLSLFLAMLIAVLCLPFSSTANTPERSPLVFSVSSAELYESDEPYVTLDVMLTNESGSVLDSDPFSSATMTISSSSAEFLEIIPAGNGISAKDVTPTGPLTGSGPWIEVETKSDKPIILAAGEQVKLFSVKIEITAVFGGCVMHLEDIRMKNINTDLSDGSYTVRNGTVRCYGSGLPAVGTDINSLRQNLHTSPASFDMIKDNDGTLTPSEDISGDYVLYIADLDDDDEEEVIVISLYEPADPKLLTIQQLEIRVYDMDDSGEYKWSDSVSPENFDSYCAYEYDGLYSFYVAVDNDKIVLLRRFNYDTDYYYYVVYSYDSDGKLNRVAEYMFTVRGYDREEMIDINDFLYASEPVSYVVGSKEARAAVAGIENDIARMDMEGLLFPLDADGDAVDIYRLEYGALFEMYNDYDSETDTKSFRVISSVSSSIPGDVDFDGYVTPNDARWALRIAAKLEEATDPEYFAADVDGNENIGANDARIILRRAAELESANLYPVADLGSQAGCPPVSAVADKTTVNLGDEFTVSVIVNDAEGLECGAAWLSFDPSLVTLLYTDSGDTKAAVETSEDYTEIERANTEGMIRNAFAYTKREAKDSVTIYTATFKAIDSGKAEFGFVDKKLYGLSLGSCQSVSITDGTDCPPELLISPEYKWYNQLLAAFRADGPALAASPVSEVMYIDTNLVYPENFKNKTGIPDATYTLRFADTDGDGKVELIAFALIHDAVEGAKNMTVYKLRVTGYDIAEDGTVRSDSFEPKGFNTVWMYEVEGHNTFYAAVYNGKVNLLNYFTYEESVGDFLIYSFTDGKFNQERHERITVDRLVSDPSSMSYTHALLEGDREYSSTSGIVGDDVICHWIGKTFADNPDPDIATALYPMDRAGMPAAESAFSEQCDLEFGPAYNRETGEKYLLFNDKTGSYEMYGSGYLSDHTPGDINGDGSVNSKDLTRLMKYLSGETADVVEAAIDVNGDGTVNSKDLTRLMKYLSGEDVTIF